MKPRWNINKTLSFGRLFNYVVGARGVGKTFNAKRYCINRFLKTGEHFLYVRRFDTEFNHKKKEKFFDDIVSESIFPDHEFKVDGYNALVDKKICGHFMALSKSKIEKSTSFPKVQTIIFDEFILDKGYYYYLPDEVQNFLELYETVARTRENVRVLFLSNAITITNPYFLFFNIQIDGKRQFYKIKDDILVEYIINNEYAEKKKQSRVGKLLSGTTYEKYAYENKFLRDNNNFICKKSGKSRHYFTMIYNNQKIYVWVDFSEGKFYVSNDHDETCKLLYSITQSDHSPNTLLLKSRQSKILTEFIQNYQLGNVYFETMNLKNIVFDIIRLSLI